MYLLYYFLCGGSVRHSNYSRFQQTICAAMPTNNSLPPKARNTFSHRTMCDQPSPWHLALPTPDLALPDLLLVTQTWV